MNPMEYCREVAKGLVPGVSPIRANHPIPHGDDAIAARRAETTLLANPALHNLMQLKIKPEEVVDYIKRTIQETFPDFQYSFYTEHIHSFLSNSNLHMLITDGKGRVVKV